MSKKKELPILCVSGTSAAGKTTVLTELNGTTINEASITVISSFTTRKLRYAEEPFRISVSNEEFDKLTPNMVQKICFGTHRYGIVASDIDAGLARGFVLIDCITLGIQQLQARYSINAICLYTDPRVQITRLMERKSSVDEIKFRMEESAIQLRDALASGFYSLFINTGIHNIQATKAMIRNFLAGHSVASDLINYESYLAELQEVLSEFEMTGGEGHV